MIKVIIDNLQYLIPAIALIIVQLIVSHKNKSIYEVKQDFIIREIKNDIARLEEKQDKHNSLIERVYDIEATLKVMDNREKVTEHRIEDLERKEGE